MKKIGIISIVLVILFGCGIKNKEIKYKFHKNDYYDKLEETKEWKDADTQTRMQLSQLSSEDLKLPTPELWTLVIEYPFITEVFSDNNLDTQLEIAKKNYNGIKELCERENAPEVLLEYYKEYLQEKDSIEKLVVEQLMNYEFNDELSKEEKTEWDKLMD